MLKCYEVQKKIRVVAELSKEAGRLVDQSGVARKATPKDLIAVMSGLGHRISYDVLKKDWNDHLIHVSYAEALADFVGFDVDDPRFCDETVSSSEHQRVEVHYPGRDGVAAFRDLVRQALRLPMLTTRMQAIQQRMSSLSLANFSIEGGQPVVDGTPHEGYLSVRFNKAA